MEHIRLMQGLIKLSLQRIKNIGKMRTHISLYNLDAIDLIDRVEHKLPKSSLVYLDPPITLKVASCIETTINMMIMKNSGASKNYLHPYW